MLQRSFSYAFPLAISALIYGIASTPAHAYLDPGTGSMILQVLLGGVAGAALVGRLYWAKFLSLLGIKDAAARAEEAEGQAPTGTASRADR